jgi:hypothetical protein
MQSIEPLEPRIAPATFIVTSLADNGPGSLRDTVADANDRPGADLIVFRAALTGTIELLSGQVVITDTLTIKGPGAAKLALNTSTLSRIFSVSDGDDSQDSPLTVSGLSFFNGVVDGGSGGAIASLESLNVKGCAFIGNRSSEAGGAIDVFQVSLDLPLDVRIRNSSFLLNDCENSAGGAISVGVTGTVMLKSCLFNFNFAPLGGAVFIESGFEKSVLLQSCRFLTNRGQQSGAVFVESDGGPVVVRDSLFADNVSLLTDGGALTVIQGSVTIDRSAFIHNTGQDGSGALDLQEISSLLVRSSHFLDNTSRGAGAEVGGGALKVSLVDDGEARIIASIISGNTASQGGGIFVTSAPGTVQVIGSKITNNHTVGNGGGILVQEDVASHEGASLDIVRSEIAGNVSEDGRGGGLAIFGNGAFTMQSCQVTQNSASTVGGGLFILNTTPSLIVASVIAQNTAMDGGGIGAEGMLELRATRILGNIAEELGGGVKMRGPLTLKSCTVSGNFAHFGGGIFTNQSISERNTIFIGNVSPDGEPVVVD